MRRPMLWFLVVRPNAEWNVYMRSITGPSHEPARWSPFMEQAIHYPTQEAAQHAAECNPQATVMICRCKLCERGAS